MKRKAPAAKGKTWECRLVSPAGHGARGVTKAMDQAPFQATDAFQALANYPYFTSNFKFHLIWFKSHCRPLQKKQAGGWGPRESVVRCCAGTNPQSWLPQRRWAPKPKHILQKRLPLGTYSRHSPKAHLNCNDETEPAGMGSRYRWT